MVGSATTLELWCSSWWPSLNDVGNQGGGTKISQNCRRIVLKNCRYGRGGVKNPEKLPTSFMDVSLAPLYLLPPRYFYNSPGLKSAERQCRRKVWKSGGRASINLVSIISLPLQGPVEIDKPIQNIVRGAVPCPPTLPAPTDQPYNIVQ